MKLKSDITSFSQHEGKSLFEVWERFKDLQWWCHYHSILHWLPVQTFYNRVDQSRSISVDAVANNMGNSTEAAKTLL